MTCNCGGKWVWRRQDTILSDNPLHRFRVNIFHCADCEKGMVADTIRDKKPVKLISNKPKIYRLTDDEKKIYEKHKMTDKELEKYMKDIKKHTQKMIRQNAL